MMLWAAWIVPREGPGRPNARRYRPTSAERSEGGRVCEVEWVLIERSEISGTHGTQSTTDQRGAASLTGDASELQRDGYTWCEGGAIAPTEHHGWDPSRHEWLLRSTIASCAGYVRGCVPRWVGCPPTHRHNEQRWSVATVPDRHSCAVPPGADASICRTRGEGRVLAERGVAERSEWDPSHVPRWTRLRLVHWRGEWGAKRRAPPSLKVPPSRHK